MTEVPSVVSYISRGLADFTVDGDASSDNEQAPQELTPQALSAMLARADSAPVRALSEAQGDQRLALYELSCVLAELSNVSSDTLRQECDDILRERCRIAFHCTDLADGVSCEDTCDFDQARQAAADFGSMELGNDTRLMLYDATSRHEFTAKLRRVAQKQVAAANAPARDRCCVTGCGTAFEGPSYRTHIHGYTYKPKAQMYKNVYGVEGLCMMHRDRLKRSRKKETSKREDLWLQHELDEDPAKACTIDTPCEEQTVVRLMFTDERVSRKGIFDYALNLATKEWTCIKATNASRKSVPRTGVLYAEHLVPVRTAKNHTKFDKETLTRMLEAQRILCNMLLFKCNECNERFPTFHPDHKPKMKLEVLATYPCEVCTFDEEPSNTRQKLAPLHTGMCQRCARDLAKVVGHPQLDGVSVFGTLNRMNLLHGIQPESPELREFHHLFSEATVVEEMLVAMHHMQVSVCTVGTAARKGFGMTTFRKNIISFPQELNELKEMLAFMSNLSVNDSVNVRIALQPEEPATLRRARIREIHASTFLVELGDDGSFHTVQCTDIEQRLKLPWKPQLLRDHLIILRRKNANRDDYTEDLRVRRAVIKRLLQLLTTVAEWRPHCGPEPLHAYYTDFDFMSDAELEEIFPEDDVPEGLHMQDLDPENIQTELSAQDFEDWLSEGMHNCDVAQALMHHWLQTLHSTDQDCLPDFFQQLVAEASPDDADNTHGSEPKLSLRYLAAFASRNCTFSFLLPTDSEEARVEDIFERIREEMAMVQSYLTVWRSSGGVSNAQSASVKERLEEHLETVVYPWPEIKAAPTPERADGRFAKAFPLTFPTGDGDLYQERTRSDFSVEDWAQHVLRFYDGRALSSLRGHRVIWAIFNTVLRHAAEKQGNLFHKQSHARALTRVELAQLYCERQDLFQKLSSYGTDIPTTSMQWKRKGNELEWIVRQMSWAAPWTSTGRDATLSDPTYKSKSSRRNPTPVNTQDAATAIHEENARDEQATMPEPVEVDVVSAAPTSDDESSCTPSFFDSADEEPAEANGLAESTASPQPEDVPPTSDFRSDPITRPSQRGPTKALENAAANLRQGPMGLQPRAGLLVHTELPLQLHVRAAPFSQSHRCPHATATGHL